MDSPTTLSEHSHAQCGKYCYSTSLWISSLLLVGPKKVLMQCFCWCYSCVSISLFEMWSIWISLNIWNVHQMSTTISATRLFCITMRNSFAPTVWVFFFLSSGEKYYKSYVCNRNACFSVISSNIRGQKLIYFVLASSKIIIFNVSICNSFSPHSVRALEHQTD